jgi:pilus assembly protein Flp/PilA
MRGYTQQTEGGTAAEYALILAIVGAAIAMSALLFAGAVSSAMNSASTTIASAASGALSPGGGDQITPPGPLAKARNPNACRGCNNGNGNTDPGVQAGGVNH